MTNSDAFIEHVLERLGGLQDVDARAMFGGHGLYMDKAFFGIVYEDRLYLKTDDRSRDWYLDKGMDAFRPRPGQELKSYFEVPADALDDPELMAELADDAIAVALEG